MPFLNGMDANYVPLMRDLSLGWKSERGKLIENFYRYMAKKGINCCRVRLWVGDGGPSRFNYAIPIMNMAREARMGIYLAIFLSEGWADLYKQPAPHPWNLMSIEKRVKAVNSYVRDVVKRVFLLNFKPTLYQVGNEIDYGICGVFASDKDRRKNLNWLKKHVWCHEAEILKSAFKGIRDTDSEAYLAIHLGKWWDHQLFVSFLQAMEDFNVNFDVLSVSFYPSMLGAGFDVLDEMKERADVLSKKLIIAEYAYPSNLLRGQFWFMSKQVPTYPMTPERQAAWIRDFISYCQRLNISGIFYWSPEMYLSVKMAKKLKAPAEMPLSFGWGPMALFDESGNAKPSINSFKLS